MDQELEAARKLYLGKLVRLIWRSGWEPVGIVTRIERSAWSDDDISLVWEGLDGIEYGWNLNDPDATIELWEA